MAKLLVQQIIKVAVILPMPGTANIMRIEESPPILKLIEENKKALII